MASQSYNEALSQSTGDDDSLSPQLPADTCNDAVVEARDQQLEKTITSEIIPRMMLALKQIGAQSPSDLEQRNGRDKGNAYNAVQPTQVHIEELAHLLMLPSADTSRRYVEQLHLQGMSMDSIYLGLLAPTANYFGDLWSDDTRDFTEVTIALSRLHAIVRRLGPSFRADAKLREDRSAAEAVGGHGSTKKALICPMPGEQHTFGCVIVEDYFKRGGWDVIGWPPAAESELLETIRHSRFDLVGLSVSCLTSLHRVADLIKDIRRSSLNPSILILAGGHAFADNPEQALHFGADATGSNGHNAVLAANRALTKLTERLLP